MGFEPEIRRSTNRYNPLTHPVLMRAQQGESRERIRLLSKYLSLVLELHLSVALPPDQPKNLLSPEPEGRAWGYGETHL